MEISDLQRAGDIVPGAETVTYTPRNPTAAGGGVKAFTLYNARFRNTPDSAEFAAQYLKLTTDYGMWIVKTYELNGYVPRVGDTLTPGTGTTAPGTWKIDNLQPFLSNGEYKLHCIRNK